MFDMNSLKRGSGRPGDNIEPDPVSMSPAPKPSLHDRPSEPATIGASITITGELSGEEDLIIQGKVDGTVTLKKNRLTIGKDGSVNANVQAHTVIVEGTLKGDVVGEEKVVIEKTGSVHGNVSAPRVSLADGAKFKGSMDMDAKRSAPPERSLSAPAPSHSSTPSGHQSDGKSTPSKKNAFEVEGV